jgi:hypothetical protein
MLSISNISCATFYILAPYSPICNVLAKPERVNVTGWGGDQPDDAGGRGVPPCGGGRGRVDKGPAAQCQPGGGGDRGGVRAYRLP